ncbi:MAG: glycosyltransferase family 4 protein [Bacteroidales bacterium]|nr:glycosyltransferase family 4 protein [Bacteroidales bacterium]
MLYYLIFFVYIAAFSLTYLVRVIALRKNIVDTPNFRSSHTLPTPRGGGLAIVLCWFTGIIYLFISKNIESHLFYALLSGIILAVVGLIDDIVSLKPIIRFIAQSVSAVLALYFLGGINITEFDNNILIALTQLFTLLGILWFINLFNFMDGIDGYASLETIFIAVGMFLFVSDLVFIILIAATAGFLSWNWPKAKIFMGDTGSTQLGFILIILGIYYHNTTEFHIVNWIILSSVFWFDATVTLFRRFIKKEDLSIAHRKHAYQRLIQGGFSHLKVDIIVSILNLALLGLVWLNQNIRTGFLLIIGILILFTFLMRIVDRIHPFRT